VTVIPGMPRNSTTSLLEYVEKYVKDAVVSDDVFSKEFLSGILVWDGEMGQQLENITKALPSGWGNSWIRCIGQRDFNGIPAPGPYILYDGKIRPALRVFDDSANAFSVCLRSSEQYGYARPKP
jgi:hypothetical protein